MDFREWTSGYCIYRNCIFAWGFRGMNDYDDDYDDYDDEWMDEWMDEWIDEWNDIEIMKELNDEYQMML